MHCPALAIRHLSQARSLFLLPWIIIMIFGWSCGDTPRLVTGPRGAIDVKPKVLNLGRVFTNQDAVGVVSIQSVGEKPIGYRAQFTAPAEGFELYGAEGTLDTQEERELVIRYESQRSGIARTRLMFIPDNSAAAAIELELIAETTATPDCEDGSGCTEDRFDPTLQRCIHEARPFLCNDFNACTEEDQCADGICLGVSRNCDDNNVCTDDLCNSREGCVHTLRADCDDANPCTIDSCDPQEGCKHSQAPALSPCVIEGVEQCVAAAFCNERGICILADNLPLDGTSCDDGDACTEEDTCNDGQCGNPSPVGNMQFATNVGTLAPGAEENPLIGTDGSIYIGIVDGVQAVAPCGTPTWTAEVGTPTFAGAVLLPDRLSVPVDTQIIDIALDDGRTLKTHNIENALPVLPIDITATSRVIDMAARTSGGLVISVERRQEGNDEIEGFLLELDGPHEVLTILSRWSNQTVSRLVIDEDESVVFVLSEGIAGRELLTQHQLVRLGIDGVVSGSWSTGQLVAAQNDIALGAAGEVLWTIGLTRVQRRGTLSVLAPPSPTLELRATGSPIVFGPWVITQETNAQASGGRLIARTFDGNEAFSIPVDAIAPTTSPVVDQRGNIFVLDATGTVRAYDSAGAPLFATPLEPQPSSVERVTLTMTPLQLLVVAVDETVYGLKGVAELADSPWPKHRRDLFGTGHR
ncbi:MAG: hypothetical protein KTR25_12375 [Myxococcales bacterium]|nr:hypothetical protein [Myxococcales bacterium]